SILSNENFIADLTLRGNTAVKNLFKTSLPGGQPGGFLTFAGFPLISNHTGTWNVHTPQAGLPTAQAVNTSQATQALPGGSVQNWPATGAGSPSYYAQTERIADFLSGIEYDQVLAGTYHNGTGFGKLTYIGGHSFATTLPYRSN